MIESRFSPTKEILPPAQKELWGALQPSCDLGFVLYGGTAIALRLGHRVSVDFDFFTDKPLNRDFLGRAFPFLGNSTVIQDEKESLSILTPPCPIDGGTVKVSFFGSIEFGRVGVPESTRDGVMRVASLDDLMATKVKTILQRVSAKDYMDIAAMVEAGVSLAKGLASAREMFGMNFQPSESMKAMIYFEGGDLHLLTPRTKEILSKAVTEVHELPEVKIIARTLNPIKESPDERTQVSSQQGLSLG